MPGIPEDAHPGRPTLSTLIPVFAAIGVFGVVYGAAAQPLFGSVLTIASSLIVFSGTVQFTVVGLVAASALPATLLLAVFVVNVRNLALGGALRPYLAGGRLRRLLLSWFLIDETVGLALATPEEADHILLLTGIGAYSSWVLGTVVGVLGGAALGVEGLAASVFPVLFIGLAALMARGRGAVARAAAGAAVTLVLLLVWPSLAGLAPVLGGVVAALGGDGR